MKFTDPRLYIQGIGMAIMTDPATGDILYWDDKFQDGNITSSADNGQINAGLGNAPAVLIPHTSQVQVAVTSAAYSNYVRSASVGATVAKGAPVMTCQTVTASGASLTISTAAGTPVPDVGMEAAYCYVQETGVASPIENGGTAYPISSSGVISNFVATSGKSYLVTYYVSQANAKLTTVTSNMKGKVVRFILQRPIYTNVNPTTKAGDLWGMHYDIIPALQLLPDGASMNGTQTSATTTAITGQAVIYDADTVSTQCENCALTGNPMWYQLDVPCDATSDLNGLVVVGGVITIPTSSTYTVEEFRLLVGKNLVVPDAAKMTYELTGAPSGTTISGNVITSGATAGDGEITGTYSEGSTTLTCVANLVVEEPTP